MTAGASGNSIIPTGRVTDGASAIACKIGNVNALTTAGAKICSFYSDNEATERLAVNADGSIENPQDATMAFYSNITAATATAGVPAYLFKPKVALENTDAVFRVESSAGTQLLSISALGTVTCGNGFSSNLFYGTSNALFRGANSIGGSSTLSGGSGVIANGAVAGQVGGAAAVVGGAGGAGNVTAAAGAGGTASLLGGDAGANGGGGGANSGSVVIDAGVKSGAGTAGTVLIGVNNASTTTIGRTGTVTTIQNGVIKGQRDVLTTLTPANGATVTIDYNLGNTFVLDVSALTNAHTCTVALSNMPTNAFLSSYTLIVKTGATLPTITWPAGYTAPALVPSKENWLTCMSIDGATTTRIFTAGVF